MKEKPSLIRIASTAAGEIHIGDKVPGRGAYICRNEDCIKKAHKIKGLERSLKRGIPSEIYTAVAQSAAPQ